MTDTPAHGQPWSDDELDALVAAYFAMLDHEVHGRAYTKARHAEALMARTGRTHRSVEYKLMNLSAVLEALGAPIIRGYRPMPNIQKAIFGAVDRFLTADPSRLSPPLPLIPAQAGTQAFSAVAEPLALYEEPPPVPDLTARAPRPEGLERLVRKFDPVERDHRNRALGRAGEEIVFHAEHARLRAADRPDLAAKVRWVAQEDGDGAGYDIRSYDEAGHERLIEVKTTCGSRTTPFFLTRNEKSLADEEPDRFRLYRLYDFAPQPKLFTLRPPLAQAVVLEAETWRAGFGVSHGGDI